MRRRLRKILRCVAAFASLAASAPEVAVTAFFADARSRSDEEVEEVEERLEWAGLEAKCTERDSAARGGDGSVSMGESSRELAC